MTVSSVVTPNLNAAKRIVAIGGGHGLGRVMSALGFMRSRLTGIVTTTDNGGSTGRIRSQFGGIAWGDLRNCLNQIITTPTTASELFEYRFDGEGELAGHNLGNLMLKALENIKVRPLDGVNLIRELLHVEPFIIPMSEKPAHLAAELNSGEMIIGEVSIDKLADIPKQLSLAPAVSATPEAVVAINQADIILFGPGSFLTSILPPLLLTEVQDALATSSAIKIFIDNLGVEHSPSAQLDLAARVDWLNRYIGKPIIDGVITDSNTVLPQDFRQNYCVIARQLNADDVSYRHDRALLSHALEDLIDKVKIKKKCFC
ncbi:gluconeogenesis factor YvcK family protein [Gallibacterium sp. AGMB14963]|uniref:gluconeogenesis factor YvcK family protein n=1 Tax=Gallibacterium faecale TaxID=3019086 RepID=UPI0022F1B273|nr:uridine diphosphate-N-acetylglucosamine-binding protein YvcK [Gallibacterium sp. AGMB14963]MDA3978287.1 uridine diphosphate-N-acetylglucosamine-binding protein YvcK [Gallibacterium sp. AGMB14963]